jgi:hypothetical protein
MEIESIFAWKLNYCRNRIPAKSLFIDVVGVVLLEETSLRPRPPHGIRGDGGTIPPVLLPLLSNSNLERDIRDSSRAVCPAADRFRKSPAVEENSSPQNLGQRLRSLMALGVSGDGVS